MPYYHVKIGRKKGRPTTLYFFDWSEEYLKFFLERAQRGEVVHFPNPYDVDAIETQYIDDIKIAKTSQNSSHYGIGYLKGENIFDKGEDVTEQFVSIPRKRGKISPSPKKVSKGVFIVHGKDHKSLNELKKMLSEFGLNPIVLHEQPSGSRTIVEKLEKYSDVDYAFVILTSDDVFIPTVLGHEVNKEEDTVKELHFLTSQLSRRARQNVVLEFGYFMGKLSRDRVCCLYKGDVELPSDMHGIVYIPFEESVNEVRDKIVKELKAVGYEIKV